MGDPLGLIGAGGGAGRAEALGPGVGSARPREAGTPDFKDVLLKNLEEVNRLQQDATQAVEDLQTGKRQDLESVLIATQKADLAFRTLQAVRNQVLKAYDEIQQMRV